MSQTSLILRPSTIMTEPMRRLYLDAFPADERRPLHLLSRLIEDPASPVTLLLLDDDARPSCPAGFITLWRLSDGTYYIEHFATLPERRGGGLGAKALELLKPVLDGSPLVIEVERPEEGETARRRIGFYERCGFTLHAGHIYIQPPYASGLRPVEMRLMTLGDLQGRDIADIAATLRREVYNAADNTASCAD